jgi:uncharacterized membrane protein
MIGASMMSAPSGARTPQAIQSGITQLERAEGLDGLAGALDPVASQAGRGRLGSLLRGDWLGHAFHPLMTDFPLGCWLSADFLDLVGGRRSRTAARRLVGLGLLAVPVTAASGMADFGTIEEQRSRRVAAVHAVGNTMVALLYLTSWRARRRGRHLRGMLWGLSGGTLAFVTGYLGGHLSFARGIGVGARGLEPDEAVAQPAPSAEPNAVDVVTRIESTGASPPRVLPY